MNSKLTFIIVQIVNHLPDLCFLDICHLKQANIRMITKKANAMDGTIITANGVVIDVSDAGKTGTFL